MLKTKKGNYDAYSTHEVAQIFGANGASITIQHTGGHRSFVTDDWVDDTFTVAINVPPKTFPIYFKSFFSLKEAEDWAGKEIQFPQSILILKYCS